MITKGQKMMWGLGAFTFLFYLAFTNILPITDPVESNYVLTAKEMLFSHSYLSPLIYGHVWFDKPPLTYWALILSFKLFGISHLTAHVPAALAASCSSMLLFFITKRLIKDENVALWSSLVMITSLEFWYISHAIVTDGFLFLFSIGIFGFFFLAYKEHSTLYITLAYICAGLAVLTKGPVGIVLPGLILLLFLGLEKSKKGLLLLLHPLGILSFILIAAPWYVAMYHLHGVTFINEFLGLHNYVRATVSEHPRDNVWFYYLALWPASLLPWIGFTVYELKYTRWKSDTFRRYALLWGGVIILFYSFVATKYLTYTFPALIPFYIITAQGIERFRANVSVRKKTYREILIAFLGLIILSLALGIGSLVDPYIRWPIILGATILVLCVAILTIASAPMRRWRLVALGSSIVLFLAVPISVSPLLQGQSSYDLVQKLKGLNYGQVYFYRDFSASFVYYSGQSAALLLDNDSYKRNVWDKGKDIMPVAEVTDFTFPKKDEKPAIVIVPKKYVEDFKNSKIGSMFKQIETVNGEYIFISN